MGAGAPIHRWPGTLMILLALAIASCAPARVTSVPGDRLETIEAELAADIAVLASDAFEGRRPGTEGEAKTLRYLAQEWQEAGLESGTNDPANPWFAPVALQLHRPDRSVAEFYRDGRRVAYVIGRLTDPSKGKAQFRFYVRSLAAEATPAQVTLRPGELVLSPAF